MAVEKVESKAYEEKIGSEKGSELSERRKQYKRAMNRFPEMEDGFWEALEKPREFESLCDWIKKKYKREPWEGFPSMGSLFRLVDFLESRGILEEDSGYYKSTKEFREYLVEKN